MEVNQEKEQVEELIENIKAKTEIASKHQFQASEKKKQLEVDNVQIKQQQLEADEILKNAIPLLESAEIAL